MSPLWQSQQSEWFSSSLKSWSYWVSGFVFLVSDLSWAFPGSVFVQIEKPDISAGRLIFALNDNNCHLAALIFKKQKHTMSCCINRPMSVCFIKRKNMSFVHLKTSKTKQTKPQNKTPQTNNTSYFHSRTSLKNLMRVNNVWPVALIYKDGLSQSARMTD